MLHNTMIIVLSFTAVAVCWSGYIPGTASIVALLGCCVALVGLPHGGLDHRVGSSLFARLGATANYASVCFYLCYLTIAAIVILGWYIAPTATIVLFFILAAWHFGLEEEPASSGLQIASHFGIAVRGGMVIWCCSAFRTAEVAFLLETIVPTGTGVGVAIAEHIAKLWPLFFCLLVADAARLHSVCSRWYWAVHLARLLAFGLLFAICPVLLSFVIYFCGWHSIKGLQHLRHQFNGSDRQFVVALLPMSVLAIGLFASSFAFYRFELSLSDAAIRTIFIGLSAVAVPHLVLHVVDDSMRSKTSVPAAFKRSVTCPM